MGGRRVPVGVPYTPLVYPSPFTSYYLMSMLQDVAESGNRRAMHRHLAEMS